MGKRYIFQKIESCTKEKSNRKSSRPNSYFDPSVKQVNLLINSFDLDVSCDELIRDVVVDNGVEKSECEVNFVFIDDDDVVDADTNGDCDDKDKNENDDGDKVLIVA